MERGRVIAVPELGVSVDVLRDEPEVLEIVVTGRPRGLLAAEHVHTRQTERHTVQAGALRLVLAGRDHVLREGESLEVPPNTPHRQLAAGEGDGRVHIEVRPAGSTLGFIERLAEYSRTGRITRAGLPKPVAAAELVRDFGADGHATRPPLAVQQALARAVLGARDRWAATQREYVFVDEWDVDAPREAVFAALSDARTYPEWWRPVYIDVEAEGPPAVGHESRQHFKGRLPYHLRTRSRTVRLEPPEVVEGEVDGDLRGRGIWTLTERPGGGTHVRFDWRVYADRPLLRALTPVLRRALRWNHDWAIARAREGLEPWARSRSAQG